MRAMPGQQYVAIMALLCASSAKGPTTSGGAATLSGVIPDTLEEQPSPDDRELGSLG